MSLGIIHYQTYYLNDAPPTLHLNQRYLLFDYRLHKLLSYFCDREVLDNLISSLPAWPIALALFG